MNIYTEGTFMHPFTNRSLALSAGTMAFLLSAPAWAHTLGAGGAGLAAGFGHPLGGLDHLLAMVAVGLWAVQVGGRALWMVPLTFMATMVVGGLLGLEGVALPGVELGIVASLIVLGSLVAFAVKPGIWFGIATVGLFAVFHGHAHGAEMPEAASPLLSALGFVGATGLLHASGIALAWLSSRPRVWAMASAWGVRSAGGAVAVSGVLFLAN